MNPTQKDEYNSINVSAFLLEIEAYPILYNLTDPGYKSKNRKELAFKEIEESLNLSGIFFALINFVKTNSF